MDDKILNELTCIQLISYIKQLNKMIKQYEEVLKQKENIIAKVKELYNVEMTANSTTVPFLQEHINLQMLEKNFKEKFPEATAEAVEKNIKDSDFPLPPFI